MDQLGKSRSIISEIHLTHSTRAESGADFKTAKSCAGIQNHTLVRNADGVPHTQVSLRHFPDDALLFA